MAVKHAIILAHPNPGSFNASVAQAYVLAATALGHKVTLAGPWSNSSAPTVILLSEDGVLHGGADRRRARFIFGR